MIYLALGSNLGDREWNLEQAKALLAGALQVDMLCSQVLETEALGFEGPAFLNQAVCFESDISPEALLDLCQNIEVQLGRPRHEAMFDSVTGRRLFSNRTIDVDILLYNSQEICTDRLTVPHPQLWERPYVRLLLNDLPAPSVLPASPCQHEPPSCPPEFPPCHPERSEGAKTTNNLPLEPNKTTQ